MRLAVHDRIDAIEHRRRCDVLTSTARPFDLLLTFDPTSSMSRTIAWISDGPWSHSATIGLTGGLYEAVMSGVREVELDHYLRSPFRLGLYRLPYAIEDPAAAEEFLRAQLGKRYAVGKAVWAGVACVLRLPGRKPLPNDLLRRRSCTLVARV